MPRKTAAPWANLAGPFSASMRPRPDAAENSIGAASSGRWTPCFNEAAARCRGKQIQQARTEIDRAASMRPRPDAAENDAERDIALQRAGLLQ